MSVKMLMVTLTNDGAPATGLTDVVIYIYDLSDNSLVVDGAAVTEVARGGYKYDFTDYDEDLDYFVSWDASVELAGDENHAEQFIPARTYELADKDDIIDTVEGVWMFIMMILEMFWYEMEFVRDMSEGKWEIDTTANQMIFYKSDNETEIARFNLFNSAGVAASDNVFKREYVPGEDD